MFLYPGIFIIFLFKRTYGSQYEKIALQTNVTNKCLKGNAHLCSPTKVSILCCMDSPGPKDSSCNQRSFWSECMDEQVDPSLRWSHLSKGMFSHTHVMLTQRILIITTLFVTNNFAVKLDLLFERNLILSSLMHEKRTLSKISS